MRSLKNPSTKISIADNEIHLWLANPELITESNILSPTETVDEIKSDLKKRRKRIVQITRNYADHLRKYAVVLGTDKDDVFEVNREKDGITNVKGFRNLYK